MHLQVSTHASLLARLATGSDSTAWNEFHDRYRELIWNFARRRGLQSSDADDVVQEVLLVVTRGMPAFKYDPAKGRFRGFLKTIALRTIWRRQRGEPPQLDQSRSDDILDSASADPEADAVWELEWRQYHLRIAMVRVRSEFNSNDLAAFDAYVGAGQDAATTAASHGLSVDQVYQAKSRILRRLKALVSEQTAEEG